MVKFQFKGRQTEGYLYLAEKGPSVLWRIYQGNLGINLDPNSPDQVLSVNDSAFCAKLICDEFPEVFSEKVAQLQGFQR